MKSMAGCRLSKRWGGIMDKRQLELYTDYLISNYGYARATGLSAMVNGEVSHDKITRFLSEREYTGQPHQNKTH